MQRSFTSHKYPHGLDYLVIFIVSFSLLLAATPTAPLYAQDNCTPLDVALLIDSTGSMSGAIDNVKAEANAIVDQIVAVAEGNYQLGLVTFRDDILVRVDMAAGTADAVKAQIATIEATSGAGTPEASDEALNTVINRLSASGRPQTGDFSGTWRADAYKVIILVTDAPPAGFDDIYSPGIDDVNAKTRAEQARDAGIRISAVYVPTTESFVAAESTDINGVTDESAEIAEMVMRRYQVITNGGFIKTNADGSGTAAAISLTIDECGAPGVVSPPSPVSVPEPITLVLFGAGLAGLAGYSQRRRRG